MRGLASFAFWFYVHKIFLLASLVGVILFVVWAVKNVPKDQLKKLSLWLIVLGLLGALLTAPVGMSVKMLMGGTDKEVMRGMMRMMR